MQKVIGVDLDEVLSETVDGVLKFHGYQINGKPATRDDITNYYIFNIEKYGLSKEEGIRYFRAFLDEAQRSEDILPVKGAKEGLEKLRREGWKIIIVTARREEIKDFTILRLNDYFQGLRDEIVFANHFSEHEKNKSELCKEHGIEIMIEDNAEYAKELADAGIHVYLLEKPWNRSYSNGMNPNITKVS